MLGFARIILFLAIFSSPNAYATEDENAENADAPKYIKLEKALANPLSNLTTVSFNHYMALVPGSRHSTINAFKIQPTFSNAVDENSFTIHQFTLPYIGVGVANGGNSVSGFSDLMYQNFFVPRGDLQPIWGIGSVLVIPSGADLRISTGKWSTGPSFALLRQGEKLNIGFVLAQAWSFAGEPSKGKVNLLTAQPIFSYFLPKLWNLSLFSSANPVTRDSTLSGQKWTVPLGLQFTKLFPRKSMPINFTIGIFSRVVRPADMAKWSANWGMNFIF